jgi:hypothetical protein
MAPCDINWPAQIFWVIVVAAITALSNWHWYRKGRKIARSEGQLHERITRLRANGFDIDQFDIDAVGGSLKYFE